MYIGDCLKGIRAIMDSDRKNDKALIEKYLHWQPNISLRQGLEQIYLWIYDQMVGK